MFQVIIGAIVSAAVGIGKLLTSLSLPLAALSTVCTAMMGFGKALGVVDSESTPESLGEKALQADEQGISPEDFPSYTEYVKKVESLEVDPIKAEKYSEEEKLIKGAELAAGATFASFEEPGPVESLFQSVPKTPEYYTEERMEEFGNMASESKSEFNTTAEYLDGTLKNDDQMAEAIDRLVAIERKIDPEISAADALRNVVQARQHEGE